MAKRRSSIPKEEEAGILQKVISYVLIGGVILSVVLEVLGMSLYYAQNRSLAVEFTTKQWQLRGADFFSYISFLLSSLFSNEPSTNNNNNYPIKIMALGVLILMLTPFVRVVASVIFFGYQKDLKYLMITFFVLIVLTLSLLTH